jgi:hypothetical protein
VRGGPHQQLEGKANGLWVKETDYLPATVWWGVQVRHSQFAHLYSALHACRNLVDIWFRWSVTLSGPKLNSRISTTSAWLYLKTDVFNKYGCKTIKQKASSKEMFIPKFSMFPVLLNNRLHCLGILKYINQPCSYICITNKLILCLKLYCLLSFTYKKDLLYMCRSTFCRKSLSRCAFRLKIFATTAVHSEQKYMSPYFEQTFTLLQGGKKDFVSVIILFSCFS